MKRLKEFWNNYNMYIICIFITLVLAYISDKNEKIGNIIYIVFLVIFGIWFAFLSYYFVKRKLFQIKIDSKDLDVINNYLKKKYHELEIIEIIDIENKHEFSCYDEFCDIWDMANMFGRYNKLYNMDIALTDEFIEYVKELNNEEINNILDESIKIKEIILKYYDENGVWKM